MTQTLGIFPLRQYKNPKYLTLFPDYNFPIADDNDADSDEIISFTLLPFFLLLSKKKKVRHFYVQNY